MNIDLSQLITNEEQQTQAHIATINRIAARRYDKEISGIIYGEYYIVTDRESQAKLLSERTAAREGLRVEGSGWKCLHMPTASVGMFPFTNAQIVDAASIAYQYVAACFHREGELLVALENGTYTDEMLEQDWP